MTRGRPGWLTVANIRPLWRRAGTPTSSSSTTGASFAATEKAETWRLRPQSWPTWRVATETATCLADLHHRLHALPPRLGEGEDDRILHLDLHPENVMLTSRGPVVIDWRNATEGPADLDVALSAIIIAQVAVEEAHPLASSAATLLAAFVDRVGGRVLTTLDQAVAMRRSDPALTSGERERLDAAAALITGRR
ncbi:phosphotransferase [Micromonospora sp. DT178]|uniref:phosphotransferase n=1 Tax=Micromonospora sp. DT178 TaxID=3393436 RepID=UPI003CEE5288